MATAKLKRKPRLSKIESYKSSLVLYSPHLNTKRQKPHKYYKRESEGREKRNRVK
jgi:hypothetical protein